MVTSQSALALLFGLSFVGGFFWGLAADLCAVLGGGLSPSSVPEIGRWLALHGVPTDTGRRGRSIRVALAQVDLFLRDLLFCVAGAVFLILLLYDVNRGIFRSFGIVCMGIGYGVYRLTMRGVWVRALLWIRAYLSVVARKIMKPIIRPFVFLTEKAIRPFFCRLKDRVGKLLQTARRTWREHRDPAEEEKGASTATNVKNAKIKGEEDEKTDFSFENGSARRAGIFRESSHRIRPE